MALTDGIGLMSEHEAQRVELLSLALHAPGDRRLPPPLGNQPPPHACSSPQDDLRSELVVRTASHPGIDIIPFIKPYGAVVGSSAAVSQRGLKGNTVRRTLQGAKP